MKQFEPRAVYENRATGAWSRELREVLPHRLTVNRDYRAEVMRRGPDTLFWEVAFVDRERVLDKEGRALLDAPAGGDGEFPVGVGEALVRAVEDGWAPGAFHVVFHSSGWDSRILSAAIRRAYRRRGAKWMGRTLFVCLGNEAEQAQRILRLEGWGAAWVAQVPFLTELTAKMCDLGEAGRWLNGVVCQGFDYNWLTVEYLQARKLAPADDLEIQVVSGRNETLMGATMPEGNGLRSSWKEAYDAFLAVSRYKAGSVLFPFCAYDVVRAGLAQRERMNWNTPPRELKCGFRRQIGEWLEPKLAGVPRGDLEVPPLTGAQVTRMAGQYQASWYGRNVRPLAGLEVTDRLLGHHPWWGAFSAAALCEALRSEGHELVAG